MTRAYSDEPLYTQTCCARSNCKFIYTYKSGTFAHLHLRPACAIYIDCEGPETPLPEPFVYLADGWSVDIPCAVDTPDRILANVVVSYQQSTTPYTCTTLCGSEGYRYAGVEYGDECYCGTGYVGEVEAAEYATECQMRCAGSYGYTCGGSWRMQTYKLD